MREHFGRDLDVKTFPDKIPAAIAASVAKCDDGDTDRLLSLCLDGVQADAGAVGRCESVLAWVRTMEARPPAYRQAFVRYLSQKGMVVSVFGRAAWEQRKQTKGGAR